MKGKYTYGEIMKAIEVNGIGVTENKINELSKLCFDYPNMELGDIIRQKTPWHTEQLMKEYNVQPWGFVKEPPTQPDYHTMALLAAQTIPNQTVGELLASADKIEAWLRKPEEDCKKFLFGFKKEFEDFKWDEPFQRKQKSPEKLNPEASDGVNGD